MFPLKPQYAPFSFCYLSCTSDGFFTWWGHFIAAVWLKSGITSLSHCFTTVLLRSGLVRLSFLFHNTCSCSNFVFLIFVLPSTLFFIACFSSSLLKLQRLGRNLCFLNIFFLTWPPAWLLLMACRQYLLHKNYLCLNFLMFRYTNASRSFAHNLAQLQPKLFVNVVICWPSLKVYPPVCSDETGWVAEDVDFCNPHYSVVIERLQPLKCQDQFSVFGRCRLWSSIFLLALRLFVALRFIWTPCQLFTSVVEYQIGCLADAVGALHKTSSTCDFRTYLLKQCSKICISYFCPQL